MGELPCRYVGGVGTGVPFTPQHLFFLHFPLRSPPLVSPQVGWLVAYLGSTIYTFVWDVSMDWRLLPWQNVASCQYGEHVLREKTMVFRSRRGDYGVIATGVQEGEGRRLRAGGGKGGGRGGGPAI
jgi:hypothetical protein